MRKIIICLVVAAAFLLLSVPAMADLYRWVDKDGNVHVTNTPPQTRGAKVERMRETNRPHVAPPKTSQKDKKEDKDKDKDKEDEKKKDKKEKEKRKFYKKFPGVSVTLYVTSWCENCKKAIEFFRGSSVNLKVMDIEKDQMAARQKNAVSPSNSVPVAVIGDDEIVVVGFSQQQYTSALESSR